MLGNYLQQTTSADDISDAFFLGALRAKGVDIVYVLFHFIQTKHKLFIILTSYFWKKAIQPRIIH